MIKLETTIPKPWRVIKPMQSRAFGEVTFNYLDWVAERIVRRGFQHYFVVKEDEVIGYVMGYQKGDLWHISLFMIDPFHQGLGVGKKTFKKTLDKLEEMSYSNVSLNTRASNKRMQGLVQQFGFVVERELPGYYSDGEDALHYIRRK